MSDKIDTHLSSAEEQAEQTGATSVPGAGSEGAEEQPEQAVNTLDTAAAGEVADTEPTSAVEQTEASQSLPALPITEPSAALTGQHLALRRQPYVKRKMRRLLRQRRKPYARPLSIVLTTILLLGLIVPLGVMIGYGIQLYTIYTQVRMHANQGVQNLESIKDLFPTPQTVSTGTQKQHLLDTAKLAQMRTKLSAAKNDFTQVRQLLKNANAAQLVDRLAPQYRPLLVSVNAAAQVGIDLATVGQYLVDTGQQLAPRLNGNLLDNTDKPLLLPSDLILIENTLTRIEPLLTDVQTQARSISIDVLPISTEQRAQLRQYLGLLPQLPALLRQGREWLAPARWLLGLDTPHTFLVQPMDRGELRSTGGFTGQYGELTINAGRLSPIDLTNIALVEYAANSPTYGDEAPEAYRSWWPFANWGLRDSNLSADFPTSAQLALERYHNDFGHNVDGVIAFTPTFIQHVLLALGPLRVPLYNEVVTAQNLEEKLHYYQLDGRGIAKEKAIAGVDDDDQARKHFTATLAHALMDRVRGAPLNELLALAQQAFQDLKTRDLQVYFTDPQTEQMLVKYGVAGLLDRSTQHDGLYIVQANVSVSKASEYVKTTFTDTVTLDASGGATHQLRMQFVYNQTGPVYGFDTYRDYVRIYVPEGARLLGGSGFDQGYDQPLCGGYLGDCPATNVYPNGELVCPPGGYDAGYSSWMLNDPYTGEVHPLDKLGPPPNQQSDEPGRAMFGGYIVIPKNCTLTATVSWYVPAQGQGHQPYSLLFQRQAGTTPEVQVTIQSAANGQCTTQKSSPFVFKGTMTADQTFTLSGSQGKGQTCS